MKILVKLFLGLFFLIVFIIFGFWFIDKITEKHVHYHVGFIVYINGQKQDYSDSQYMTLDICKIENVAERFSDKERVHLHDNIGDVAHVHDENVLWSELFKNINVTLPKGQPVVGYENGLAIKNILNQEMKPYESVIIVIGDNKGIDLIKTVTKKHIRDVEANSEYCNK